MDCSQAVLTLFLLVPCGEPAGEAAEDALTRSAAPPAVVEPAAVAAPLDMARTVADPPAARGEAPSAPVSDDPSAVDEAPAPNPG